MTKKTVERLKSMRGALSDLIIALETGKPFIWGAHEADSKETTLHFLGYAVVSRTKLEKGGHELKRNVKPIGKRYYNAPLNRYADLYLLGVQTRRASKWWDLFGKDRALLEDGSLHVDKSLLVGPLVPKELREECETAVRTILRTHRDASESEMAK